jgi:DNA polymerase-3 subunit alpha
VQHRIAKNGKGWGMFTPKGMMKGGIFGEEYLKFRHFIQNNSLLT